jgi:hypothetical protein
MRTIIEKYYGYSNQHHRNHYDYRVSFNEYHKVRNRLSAKLKLKIISNEFP